MNRLQLKRLFKTPMPRRTRPIGKHAAGWSHIMRLRMQKAPETTHYGCMVPIRRIKRSDKSRHLRWLRWARVAI